MLDKLFNWKKYPASIFYIAIPLFLIGFGSMGVLAFLHWKLSGDIVYACIFGVGLIFALAVFHKFHGRFRI